MYQGSSKSGVQYKLGQSLLQIYLSLTHIDELSSYISKL